jgi:hypothetical protein
VRQLIDECFQNVGVIISTYSYPVYNAHVSAVNPEPGLTALFNDSKIMLDIINALSILANLVSANALKQFNMSSIVTDNNGVNLHLGEFGTNVLTRLGQIADAIVSSNNAISEMRNIMMPSTGPGIRIYQYGLDQDEAGKIQRAMLVKSILNDASALKELLAEINNPTRILS